MMTLFALYNLTSDDGLASFTISVRMDMGMVSIDYLSQVIMLQCSTFRNYAKIKIHNFTSFCH